MFVFLVLECFVAEEFGFGFAAGFVFVVADEGGQDLKLAGLLLLLPLLLELVLLFTVFDLFVPHSFSFAFFAINRFIGHLHHIVVILRFAR